ncbi:MAG: DNA mismatch repair protein MutL [Planctomycetaceae bacterium]|nr:DNA mismatch repair protein MutL [Planctomycetaceae bacterium]
MARIAQLSTSIINKIAAGEVIERPASVVKELVENSVDAGATRIDVTVEEGGSSLIRVVDNGSGIDPDQIEMAVDSHATSKIRTADDLFSVSSMGFRGEALASISEVSNIVIRSRTAEHDAGMVLEVNGGNRQTPEPIGCPVGTMIEIRNLFFNTPVRRKYLKTPQTEMGHITEAFTRIALVHPQIHFSLKHNDRMKHDLPAVNNWKDRIAHFYGRDLAEGLIWVKSQDEDVSLSGYVADPSFYRSNTRMQYLFLNNRHIRDRSLQHALGEAYRGLLLHGRYPIVFLKMDMPPEMVDVNVHPTKLEVRFQDGRRLYSQLLSTIRNKFLTTDLTAHVGQTQADTQQNTPASQPVEETRKMDFRFAGSQANAESIGQVGTMLPDSFRRALDPQQLASGLMPEGDPQPADAPIDSSFSNPHDSSGSHSHTTLGIQIQNRYLVTEDERGMVVIDQHALHERILYEQLRKKTMEGSLETQRLLVPEPVTLTPAEAAAVLDNQEQLKRLGIEVEPFGGDTVLVSSYPAMLRRLKIEEMIRQLVDVLLSGKGSPDKRDVLDDLLAMMACKAAVKAGDPLTTEEIKSLLELQHLCQDSHHCPHGRPSALVFSRDELDKRFQRTGI